MLTRNPTSSTLAKPDKAERGRLRNGSVPQASAFLGRWFRWYAQGYVAKHFSRFRLLNENLPTLPKDVPVIVFLNHASWWDPMLCLLLADRFFPERNCHAPIDARALEKYAFFKKLGFFGVEQGTARGAVQFLRTSQAILDRGGSMLWLTPQGAFEDQRMRPIRFEPGLAHLVERTPDVILLPLAFDFSFGAERKPEVAARFGPWIRKGDVAGTASSANDWNGFLENALTQCQDRLAKEVQRRDEAAFIPLQNSGSGIGGIYDLWRRVKAWTRGQRFSADHGDLER